MFLELFDKCRKNCFPVQIQMAILCECVDISEIGAILFRFCLLSPPLKSTSITHNKERQALHILSSCQAISLRIWNL